MPDAFTDPKRVTKSNVPAVNAHIRIDVPEGIHTTANESKARLKRGRPVGSKDKNPRKRKGAKINDGPNEKTESFKRINEAPKEPNDITKETLEEFNDITNETQVPEYENEEISINYVMTGIRWNRITTDVNDNLSSHVAREIMDQNEDLEPVSIEECRKRKDWPKWKDAINKELNSLNKRNVFGPVVRTPKGVRPVGHKWVFVRKRNEKNEVVRYKARLVAQGFTQRPEIDYEETFVLVTCITYV